MACAERLFSSSFATIMTDVRTGETEQVGEGLQHRRSGQDVCEAAAARKSLREQKWYAMRVYQNERKAEELLADKEYGLKHFIPKREVLRTRHGKKVLCCEPVIRSLVFVRASQEEIVRFKQNRYNGLQFVVWKRDGNVRYLTVPDAEMENFILVCEQCAQKVKFHNPSDRDFEQALEEGDKVRIHGGVLDTLEGYVAKVKGSRGRQLVVVVSGVLAVSTAQVKDGLVEVIEKARDKSQKPKKQ